MQDTAPKDQARFAAFSFVDRITLIDGLKRVSGVYTIPAHIEAFPVSLVAEAIGQLAAWVAMSHVAFTKRPVAALAGATEVYAIPAPGQTLVLDVDIDSCDEDAIVYRGRASVDGVTVLSLADTLGSMLDVAQFDDPARLAADFDVLVAGGREPGRFQGVMPPQLTLQSHEPGVRVQTLLDVPAVADFFDDHFPRNPVYPATLLLDALMRQAAVLARDVVGREVQVQRITHVKVRAFTSPGTQLTLFAESAQAVEAEAGVWMLKVGAQNDGRTIAGARIFFK